MRKLLLLTLFVFTSLANAALIKCHYQEVACDENGGHYQCNLYAWGSAKFCSQTDVSSRKKSLLSHELEKSNADDLETILLCDSESCIELN